MRWWRPRSLTGRVALVAGVVLAAFLGLAGAGLDRAFREALRVEVRERLEARVYGILAAAEPGATGALVVPGDPPDPGLSLPGSGLYARIDADGGRPVWRSRSALGRRIEYPSAGAPGEFVFGPARSAGGGDLFGIALAVRWALPDGRTPEFVVRVAESEEAFVAQLDRFRRSLGGWLAGAAVLLLAFQAGALRWALAPLRAVAREVREIEAGDRERLEGTYPPELAPLTGSLNALIASGRRRVARYRDALDDLAHSLKTPLAVLRGGVRETTLTAQVERMDRAIDYHLRRAAAVGAEALGPPVSVRRVAERLRDALAKVHVHRGVAIGLEIDPGCAFAGDEGDLTEVLGNLMDNACKWARSEVRVHARIASAPAARAALHVEVEDDGPGIAPEAFARLGERGVRADTSVPGEGIGLAVVRAIVVGTYGGSLDAGSGALGGAHVRAVLPST